MDKEAVLASSPVRKVAALAHALSVGVVINALSAIGLARRLDFGNGNTRWDRAKVVHFRIADLSHLVDIILTSAGSDNGMRGSAWEQQGGGNREELEEMLHDAKSWGL